jgi:hypothetical protein
MSRHKKTTGLYWKDALRHLRQISLDDEVAVARRRNWASAFQQAQADLKDPSAIVWLPDEIADAIRQTPPVQEPPPTQAHRQRLSALLLVLIFLVPAAISYLLACRRISGPVKTPH